MSLPQLDVRFASLVGDLSRVVRGEVRATTLDRGLFAADASPYEVAPLAVASPRDAEDLAELVAWCRDHDVPVLPGAGTSLAGQSVGEAVVVDCSTHLNRILHLDPEARTARVEPGVVLDDLRRAAGRHGLTFGPDVSTATHATLGGMMGNASAGASSIIHGMTDEHVRSIDAVLADGRRLELGAVDPSTRGPEGKLARGLESIVRPLADEIHARFPRVARNVGGYRLDDVLHRLEHGDGSVDLARFLVGSEGTLAVTAAATVRLVERPAAKAAARRLVRGCPAGLRPREDAGRRRAGGGGADGRVHHRRRGGTAGVRQRRREVARSRGASAGCGAPRRVPRGGSGDRPSGCGRSGGRGRDRSRLDRRHRRPGGIGPGLGDPHHRSRAHLEAGREPPADARTRGLRGAGRRAGDLPAGVRCVDRVTAGRGSSTPTRRSGCSTSGRGSISRAGGTRRVHAASGEETLDLVLRHGGSISGRTR